MTGKYHGFAAHSFTDLTAAKFDPKEYSKLKFGCDRVAYNFGVELASKFFDMFREQLVSNPVVVHSSPYNVVPNAATLMTNHFLDRLNELMVHSAGIHVDYSTVHRTVSYRQDYSKMSKEHRLKMISNDNYYVNRDFIGKKTIVFIDDIHITGTHEVRILDVLKKNGIENDVVFACFARYLGNKPSIESELNLSEIDSLESYIQHTKSEFYHVNTRAIKFVLEQRPLVLRKYLPMMPLNILLKMYHGSLAEGYYKIPEFTKNFQILVDEKIRRTENKALSLKEVM